MTTTDEQIAQLKDKKHGSDKSGGGPDFDAEHQHGTATRASNAKLKRIASVDDTPASDAARKQQGDKAKIASAHGVADAVAFATKQILELAHEINKAFEAPPDEAGWDRRMQLLQGHVTVAQGSIERFSRELAIAKDSQVPMEEAEARFGVFSSAYQVLSKAVVDAQKAASRAHQAFTVNLHTLDAMVGEISRTQNWQAIHVAQRAAQSGMSVTAADAGDKNQMLSSALRSNLVALTESARMARMSLQGAPADALGSDISRVNAHLMAVDDLMKVGDPKSMAACKPQAKLAKQEVQELYRRAQALQPQLANQLQTANMDNVLKSLQAKVIHE